MSSIKKLFSLQLLTIFTSFIIRSFVSTPLEYLDLRPRTLSLVSKFFFPNKAVPNLADLDKTSVSRGGLSFSDFDVFVLKAAPASSIINSFNKLILDTSAILLLKHLELT